MLLKQFIGPNTKVGQELLPALFNAIVRAKRADAASRTKLIYTEWARLFGQVDGTETERLSRYLEESSTQHGIGYTEDPQAYVFALSTYIAIVAKVCAVYSLAAKSDPAFCPSLSPISFLKDVEEGDCFRMYGIENMLGTDFFSWYLGDDIADDLSRPLGMLLERLRTIDFDVTRKSPESVRDLFKGLYMGFTPLRCAMPWANTIRQTGWRRTCSTSQDGAKASRFSIRLAAAAPSSWKGSAAASKKLRLEPLPPTYLRACTGLTSTLWRS